VAVVVVAVILQAGPVALEVAAQVVIVAVVELLER
jgi:hypothetical protein